MTHHADWSLSYTIIAKNVERREKKEEEKTHYN
jgi:hypothetical protein